MSKLIGKILVDIIPEQHLWKLQLFNNWDSIIGNLKDKVRIEKIYEKSLILGVCHPAWAQELLFLSPVIKKKINTIFQEEKIKNIKFRIVSFKKKQKNNSKKSRPKNKNLEHCLTITEHSTLEALKNKELAGVLEHFCMRCKKIRG